jgi:ankyrin repeat protein
LPTCATSTGTSTSPPRRARRLIEAKAKVNQAEEDGATPIYIASQCGKLEVVKALIEAKAKVNQAKENGCTPIYKASQHDHPLVVQVLIDAGARSAEPVFCGYSPLHIASHAGSLECVKVLTGFRPDMPAVANKKTDVAKLLWSMMVLPKEDGSKKATKGDTRSE